MSSFNMSDEVGRTEGTLPASHLYSMSGCVKSQDQQLGEGILGNALGVLLPKNTREKPRRQFSFFGSQIF